MSNNLEQGPLIGLKDLVGHALAHCLYLLSGNLGAKRAQIIVLDLVRGHVLQDLLLSIGQNKGAQHIMALDQTLDSLLQASEVDTGSVKLQIDMGRNIAQFKARVTSNPVCLL